MDLKKYIRSVPDYPKKGILFRDITTLIKNKNAFKECIDQMSQILNKLNYDKIVAVESRGFIIGSILAYELDKGIILLRSKKKRLPGKVYSVSYDLEYGQSSVEVQEGSGDILIFDDVLATGGTTNGSIACLIKAGYKPIGALYLVELKFLNPQIILPYGSIIQYE